MENTTKKGVETGLSYTEKIETDPAKNGMGTVGKNQMPQPTPKTTVKKGGKSFTVR